jgi:hypothetical protein
MPAVTSNNLANAIVKLVAADALPGLIGNLLVGNLVNRNFEPVVVESGSEVDTVPNGPGPIGRTRMKDVSATFNIPDVTKIVSVPDLLKLYMGPALTSLAGVIEGHLLSLASLFTHHNPVGMFNEPLQGEDLGAAETALFEASVPPIAPKFAVLTPQSFSSMRAVPGFSVYDTAGDAGLRSMVEGAVGRYKGVFVFRSNIPSNHATGRRGLMFTREAMSIVTRRLPCTSGKDVVAEYAELGNFGMQVDMRYQPNTLTQEFSIGVRFGVCTHNLHHGVILQQ